jgi:uncharacterized membrane protein
MSLAKRILLWVMAAFYVFAGVNHFRDPDFYLPMMPPWLPAHLELVYLSGIAELVLGVAVLIPALQQAAAWAIVALLVAIFPANLHVALYDVPIGGAAEGYGIWNWVRLPFQLLFIAWAWWYTRPDSGVAIEAGPPPAVSKPAVLRRMDALARDPAVMQAALEAIRANPDLQLLDLGVQHGYVENTDAEAGHLRRDWFDSTEGWWHHLPPIEPVLRQAFIKAAELALEHKLPVDSYWIRRGDTFEVAVCQSDHQITLLFMSPEIPWAPVGFAKIAPRPTRIWMFGGQRPALPGNSLGATAPESPPPRSGGG